ncbi:MAG: 3D domain-containing protein [Ignavibacteriales bacterium]
MLALMLSLGIYFCLEKTVTIKVDKKVITCSTFEDNVGEVLKDNKIVLNAKDLVEPGAAAELKEDLVIKVTRAYPVTIVADGKTAQLVSTPITVSEALKQAKLALGPKDLVSADLKSLTQQGQTIKVTRVTDKVIDIRTEIPYQQQYVADATLERGLTRTRVPGRLGLAQEVVKVTYHDGKEVRREVLKAEVIRKPTSQVLAMGTITQVSRGGLRLNFNNAIMVSATAYTYTGNHTATGLNPAVGLVAVDPRVIPMGTKLYIEGYGYARAADRGSGIKGNELDVFMETLTQCKNWGRRMVKVYILK